MNLLLVHPSPLMYTKIYLRLEPLGLELVAAAALRAGHRVTLLDLQVESHDQLFDLLNDQKPDAVGFSCNYLANVPEIIDLVRAIKRQLPNTVVFVGGHSASFVAQAMLDDAAGDIDCVLRGEGEGAVMALLEAIEQHRPLTEVPGALAPMGEGPPPQMIESLNDLRPARHLLRHRRKYFIGVLDPCASIEFTRGCPWDCSFCSAWTFYGRSYRTAAPEMIVEDLASIQEPGVFIVDDVAFIHAKHGLAIGEAIARRGIKKQYYLETRGDVLLRNKEVFQFWKTLGLAYMFIGIEAIDEEGLTHYRKRISMGKNFEALEFARSLGITVAINLIADPGWDRRRFEVVRQWCLDIPEIVNISVNTPYPGTETWHTEGRCLTTRDYRLFDIQHAVLPTFLPLPEFYEELVKTQQILNQKHLGWTALKSTARIAAGHLLRGQTNFVKMLWKFSSVYDPALQMADHARPIQYQMPLPPDHTSDVNAQLLYIHRAEGRKSRLYDDATEHFVNRTRSGTTG
ncbi:Cobalamin B12-binding/Radical SAM family protein [Nitrospira sp. KM1]|uniref:hopanoid C-3 methylase HpnR n=1 Tax=Nitrospira sp. KM1 TaxID=1936990 RepID=UPI0013A7649B|nr:hopanoid C-3 methylase HpnR [Nitrospira sp. KM1]BCA53617.1 Cobalamin B12-binding/Radical SAM family protein [Nitrospira sp. KM1]